MGRLHQLFGTELPRVLGAINRELAAKCQREASMITLIEKNRPEVAELCSRFGVQNLEVFGSAADGPFDPSRSDIDFLVEFSPEDAGSLFHRYFGLQEACLAPSGYGASITSDYADRATGDLFHESK